MSQLEQLIDEIEQKEADEEMFFSLYSIPNYYQQSGETYDSNN